MHPLRDGRGRDRQTGGGQEERGRDQEGAGEGLQDHDVSWFKAHSVVQTLRFNHEKLGL